MIPMTKLAGSTSQSVIIRIIDSTDGTPETGVVAATSGLALKYRRDLGADTALTAASDLAALTTAFAAGGMKHIGDGYYRVDPDNAAFAAGAPNVLIHGAVTGMIVIGCLVELVAYDPYTAPATALDAAGTRTALGMASANLDTQLDAIPTNTDLATALGTADDAVLAAIAALNNLSQANIRSALGLTAANLENMLGYKAAGTFAACTTSGATVASGDKTKFVAGDILAVLVSGVVVDISYIGSDYSTSTGAFTWDPALITTQTLTAPTYIGLAATRAPTTSVPTVALTSTERTTLAGVVWNSLTAGFSTVGSAGKRLVDYLTGDIFARLGAPAGASTAADIAAVKAVADAVASYTDTEIATLLTNVAAILAAVDTEIAALPTATQNADALLDRVSGVEAGYTPRQALRLILSAAAGKASGLGTTTATFRDVNDSKDRIVATVDSSGNRSAVTKDVS